MKKILANEKVNISGGVKTFFALQKNLSDERLRKLMRRGVKKVPFPADLGTKIWNLLRKQ